MLAFYLAMLDDDSQKALFSELYNKYEGMMYNISYKILQDSFLAEDAVHDAFMRLTGYISKIQDAKCHKTKALIVITTKSCAIDIYRKRNRQFSEELTNLEDEELIDNTELPLDKVISEERSKELIGKLLNIRKEYMDVILLRYLYDYSTGQIAQILGLTPENARKRLSRAKQAAQRLLYETDGTRHE